MSAGGVGLWCFEEEPAIQSMSDGKFRRAFFVRKIAQELFAKM
jgi:hypothetical protein